MSIFDELNSFDDMGTSSNEIRQGLTLAKVVNIDDPDKLGRVRCQYFTFDNNQGQLEWAYVMTPFGGKDYGIFFRPNVNDIVLLGFEGNNVSRPFVLGCVWHEDITPPVPHPAPIDEAKKAHEVYQITTPQKNNIILSDKDKKESITVKTPKEAQMVIDDEKEFINITDKQGKNFIKIDIKGGEITVKCEKKLSLEVGGDTKIIMDGTSKTIEIETKNKISTKSANLSEQATSGTAEMKAVQVDIQATGITQVKGQIVKIN